MKIGPFVLALCAGGAACTPSTVTPPPPLPPECDQEPTSQISSSGGGDAGVEVDWLGVVKLLERQDRQNNVTQATAGASFYDVSNYSVTQPSPLEIGPTCVSITGVPVISGTRSILDVDFVEITGVTGGTLTLGAGDGGALTAGPTSGYFGTESIDVNIAGLDGGFPSTDFTPMAPPPAINVSEPDLSGGFSNGGADLVVKWTPRDGADNTISVNLVYTYTDATGMHQAVISCVVKDDGCYVVPAGSLSLLVAGGSDPITVSLKRTETQSGVVPSNVDGGVGAIFTLETETRGRINP